MPDSRFGKKVLKVGEQKRQLRRTGSAIIALGLVAGLSAQSLPGPSPAVGGIAVASAATARGSSSDIHVDLTESVGKDWFAEIGDRSLQLSRIDGVGLKDLPTLDVPQLLKNEPQRFIPEGKVTSDGGKATFRDVEPGVYLIDVADDPSSQDPRVSYAPFVVAVSGDGEDQRVELKAQVLNVSITPRTSCLVPGERHAVAPGGRVKYEVSAATPNISTDGTIGHYRLSTELSDMHDVQDETGESVRIFAAGEMLQLAADTANAKRSAVESVRIVGAGEAEELDTDEYTVELAGAKLIIELKVGALKELAQLRALDPNTTVKATLSVRAKQDAKGELHATTTLATDGMDAERSEVEASGSTSISIIKFESCFPPSESSTQTTKPTPQQSDSVEPAPSTTESPSNGMPAVSPSQEPSESELTTKQPSQPSEGPGFPVAPDKEGHIGPLSPEEGDPEGVKDGGADSGILGSLASTGASVIGITVAAVLLILVGLILLLRRRREEEDESLTQAEAGEE